MFLAFRPRFIRINITQTNLCLARLTTSAESVQKVMKSLTAVCDKQAKIVQLPRDSRRTLRLLVCVLDDQ